MIQAEGAASRKALTGELIYNVQERALLSLIRKWYMSFIKIENFKPYRSV